MTDQTTTASRTSGTSSPPTGQAPTTAMTRDVGNDITRPGSHDAGGVVDEARRHTSKLAGETGDRARQHADEQLRRSAGFIDQLGGELEDMATNSSRQDGYLVALARDGAQSARDLSRRVEDGGLEGVLDDVTRFARRRPAMFLAASFAVGLALGRVTRNADFGRIQQDMAEGTNDQDEVGMPSRSTVSSMSPGITT